MKDEVRAVDVRGPEDWVGWCCSYCAAPLEVQDHGLLCRNEGRFFATVGGVHRLLPEDRRREVQPVVELRQRERRDRDQALSTARGERDRALGEGLQLVAERLRGGRWDVLDVGGGEAAARLLALGHRVAAVDVALDDGKGPADPVTARVRLPRAQAEVDALPIEPQRFDLVMVTGSLPQGSRLARALVEIRRVTRRGGVLLLLEVPVYRRREDGEAGVARALREQQKRYRVAAPRESQPGYLGLAELAAVFARAGWTAEVHGWPERLREWASDVRDLLRRGRRSPRFPIVLARRDG
jgi:SAM-dependent methyltransferase